MTDATLVRIRSVLKNIIICHCGSAAELAVCLLNIVEHYCRDNHARCQHHPKEDKSGKPYHVNAPVTCQAQIEALTALLTRVGGEAQAYLDARGSTTNLCEGFHRVMLIYRDKVVLQSALQYTLRSDMSILHLVRDAFDAPLPSLLWLSLTTQSALYSSSTDTPS